MNKDEKHPRTIEMEEKLNTIKESFPKAENNRNWIWTVVLYSLFISLASVLLGFLLSVILIG